MGGNCLPIIVSVFQASTGGAEVAESRSEGERSVNHKPNGSYKILNRFVKPFINKKVGFIFPGLTSRSGEDSGLIIPDDCKKIGICEDILNYPEALVSSIIQDLEKSNVTKFNKDVLDTPQIVERIGPEDETIELCHSIEKLYAPRAAQDANKEWHVIVNDKKKPQQTYRVELCHTNDSPCSSVAYFQNGYEARCVQKYMLRQMVALNEHNEIVERPFQVPSCCSCVVKVV